MATPTDCLRLFEILTALTFGALGTSHIVSTAFETIVKTKTQIQGRLVVPTRSAIYLGLSRARPGLGGERVSVDVGALTGVW